ncbi:MAG TPA: hypothetical protein VKC56_03525 [Gallionellaceae bacterium]|nr:hypothetical protein [Gallionellaceae bacterium]
MTSIRVSEINPNPFQTGRQLLTIAMAVCALGLLALAPQAARACAACGDTISTAWQTQGLITTPGLTLGLAYNYIDQNQQRYGRSAASGAQIDRLLAAGQEVETYTRTQTATASLNYTNDRWGVIAEIPYLYRSHATWGTTAPLGSTYLTSAQGSIGDIRVLGRYAGLSEHRTSGFIVGAKLPTGSTDMTFNDGTPVDRSLQIGTGSTDIILGGYATGAFSDYGWFVQGTVQHAVATQTLNGLDYRPGDSYQLNSGIRKAKFGEKFSPMLQFNVIHRRPDSGSGATPPDVLTGGPTTGGTLAYLAPGAALRLGGGLSAYGFVQLPVYQNVNSLQLVPRYTLTVGMQQTL